MCTASLQSFVSTHSEESDSLLFIFCLQKQMLLTPAFSKENSDVSLEEFNMLSTATRKLRVLNNGQVILKTMQGFL